MVLATGLSDRQKSDLKAILTFAAEQAYPDSDIMVGVSDIPANGKRTVFVVLRNHENIGTVIINYKPYEVQFNIPKEMREETMPLFMRQLDKIFSVDFAIK